MNVVQPVDNCGSLQAAIDALCLLSLFMTSFLFLRRVQAVYAGNRFVWWGFGVLWFCTSILNVTLFPGIHSHHIAGTHHCVIYAVESYVSTISFMVIVFDTLVFFAIFYKIASQSFILADSGWSKFFPGKALPALSRAILQGGQRYYL